MQSARGSSGGRSSGRSRGGPAGQWEAERDAYWSRIEQPDSEQFDLGRARGLQLSPAETMRDALSVD
jgi:hypothetical protein